MVEFIRRKLAQLESLADSANVTCAPIPTYIIQDFIEEALDELDDLEIQLEQEP